MCGVKWEQLKPKTEPSRIRFYVLFSAGFVPKFSRKGKEIRTAATRLVPATVPYF